MMRQEEKSSRDQMETVTCMSLEEMEWSILIAEEEDSQECGDVISLIVMVYSRASTSTLGQGRQVFSVAICHDSLGLLETTTGRLSSAVIYFILDSEANEDPPEFTLTCQSRGGPVTEVEWMRNGVRVEEDSNHMTSQIIVDTSANTVYNNTLRVRGRERGEYECDVRNNYNLGWSMAASTLVVRGEAMQTKILISCHRSCGQKLPALLANFAVSTPCAFLCIMLENMCVLTFIT